MDTLTHGFAGALLARALPAPRNEEAAAALRRREAWAGFAAAMFPDADALLSPFSTDFYVTHHRGLSHSFVLLPAWALVLGLAAAVSWRRGRPSLAAPDGVATKTRFLRLVLVTGVGVGSHVLLDWITSFGTMFLSPLSWRRFALDWVFILDFRLTALLVLGLLAAGAAARGGRVPFLPGPGRPPSEGRGRRFARGFVLASAAYVGYCGLRHAEALALAERLAPEDARVTAAIPQPLSPDRWLLLFDRPSEVTGSFVDLDRSGPAVVEGAAPSALPFLDLVLSLEGLYGPPLAPRREAHARVEGPRAREALDAALAGPFGRFARFPIAKGSTEPDGGVTVTLRDLRFGLFSGRFDPFVYEVRYDAAGRVVAMGFKARGAG